MDQIKIHKKIKNILTGEPNSISKDEILALVNTNNDAKYWFYANADEPWLDWLWSNGFLDEIKKKSEDPTKYGGMRIPELDYLVRMTEKKPGKVVDIILQVPISKENFNPGVLNRFTWICGNLPAKELKRIVPFIEKQKWIPLMGPFNDFGFDYERMLQTLKDKEDWESLIRLSKAILSVRTKEEVGKDGFKGISTENPFYFNDLSYTKVFEHLASVKSKYFEQTLKLVTDVMSAIISLGDKSDDEGEVFGIKETFHLYDVDFFTLDLEDKRRHSHRDDVRGLAAVIKELAKKTIGEYDTDPQKAKELYKSYFENLPDSKSMWRLKLYVLSLQPEMFKDNLKEAFFRLFKVMDAGKSYYEIVSGAEYERALQNGFHVLSPEEKKNYVNNIIKYFKKADENRENDKENWHLRYGGDILSVIYDELKEGDDLEDLLKQAEKIGFKINPEHKPEPSIVMSDTAGTVVPRSPVDDEYFESNKISDIVERLKGDLSPKTIREVYKERNIESYHRPISAEGVSGNLNKSLSKRLQEYLDNSLLFFDRDNLDAHYTYSFLRGIQEILRKDDVETSKLDFDNLIALCLAITKSGKENPFDMKPRNRHAFDDWLSGWRDVYSAVSDVVQELINGRGDGTLIDFPKYRDDLFSIISELLRHPDPEPKEEELEDAKIEEIGPGNKHTVSDPFTVAINSVRGRAFQTFVLFLYQDGKEDPKIKEDVKKLYEEVLKKEKTRALMFIFGHYLPSFYFRDLEWMKKMLPFIFPEDPSKKYQYIAAWEGYLSTTLYMDMFSDPDMQKLYERGIKLTETKYPNQKHFREPDKGIAIHLALAFMHYEQFGFEHPLFKEFWANEDIEQHTEFVSFLGRSFISGSNVNSDELLKTEPRAKKRLKELWDYLLDNYDKSEPFKEMGFWVSFEKDVFEPKWLADHLKRMLQKTKGVLNWELGLTKTLSRLAEEAPEDMLEIARLYLVDGTIHGENRRMAMRIDRDDWLKAFEVLYKNPKTKEGTYKLISDLIEQGGGQYWDLKKVLGDDE